MDLNFTLCTINRLIIHEIFKKQPGDEEAGYIISDELIAFDVNAETLIKSRLSSAFGKESNSFAVGIKNYSTNSFFNKAINCRNADDPTFISCSSDMCKSLASELPAQTSGGYLIIVQGQYLNRFFLTAIKADKTEALQSSGNNLQVLSDIFLSPSAKFFKIGLISQLSVATDLSNPSSYESVLFDEQFRNGSHLAKFFYDDFCGFDVTINSKIRTKSYWSDSIKSITKHFNGSNYHEGTQVLDSIANDLMHSNSRAVSPADFAVQYLKSPFLEIFQEEVVSKYPETFLKDSSLLDRSLAHKNIFFNEVKLTGPTESFNEAIEIINTPEELSSLHIGNDVPYTIVKIMGYPKPVKDIKPKTR